MGEGSLIKVVAGLIAGLAIIMYFQPPHTPCQAQVEVYSDSIKTLGKPFVKALANCKEHPEPGGCLAFFDVLNKIEGKFSEVTKQCQIELKTDDKTRNWITTAMELLARAAWGSVPPPSYVYRAGWLDLGQTVEFCRLKSHLESIYGKESWDSFATGVLADLPGAELLIQSGGEGDAWNRSLLSDSCQYTL